MRLLFIVMAVLVLIVIILGLYIVPQQQAYIIERLGKYHKVSGAGLHVKIPFIDSIVCKMNLKILQMTKEITTKTKDNVFVTIVANVQYKVNTKKIRDAFYQLEDPEGQITSYIEDSLRSTIPKMTLDEAFDSKDEIVEQVQDSVSAEMDSFGYNLVKTLITEIEPDQSIIVAMNSINEANRKKVAAQELAEADRIAIVTKAKAEAEEAKLRGIGVANQRKAIVEGLAESVQELKGAGLGESEIMSILLTNQYIDTLNKFAEHESSTVFLPASPNGVEDVRTQILSALKSNIDS